MKNSLETVIVSLILYCRASGKTQHLDREINNRMHNHTGTIQREHIEVKEKYKAGTLLKVSLILLVTAWSQAVRFQILKKKVENRKKSKKQFNEKLFAPSDLRMSSWNLMETTAPQISSPTMNCSPSIASTKFSQHRELKPGERRVKSPKFKVLPFLSRTIHLPPNLLASSSHMGLIPGKSIKEQTNFELTHLKEVKVAVAGQFARFHLKMDVT